MIKVHILDRCGHCEGAAYLPIGEATSYTGEKYMQYEPCPQCHRSGKHAKWISLKEFAELLDRAISLEPDYEELASHKPISQYQDSRECAGI